MFLLEVKNRNMRVRYETCSKLTIKRPEQRHWRRSGVFIVNFKPMSYIVLLFLFFNFEHVTVGWVQAK